MEIEIYYILHFKACWV